jgi:tetratricopeptide (TPR) repeat protein
MHDLLRLYARELADAYPDERDLARNRLMSYYHGAAVYLDAILTRQPPPKAIEPPAPTARHEFADYISAIAWARRERGNLLACAEYTIRNPEKDRQYQEKVWIILFASALAGFLRNEGLWNRSIEIQTRAISLTLQLDAHLAAANALSERAVLFRLTSQPYLAIADLEKAIAIYRENDSESGRLGEAHALNTHGVILDQLKRPSEARQLFSSALDIYRRLNDQLGEANVLHDQGMAEFFTHEYRRAVSLIGQALKLYETIGQPLGMAHAHANLAKAQRRMGLDGEAARNLESAQALYDELGDHLGVVTTLIQRGAALRERDRGEAIQCLNNAIELSRKIGHRLGVVNALDELGELHMAAGETLAAVDDWTRALEITKKQRLQREADSLANKLRRVHLTSES